MNPRGAHIHSKPSWTDLMAFLKNPCVICSWDCAYRIIWRRKPYLIAIQKKRISSFFPHTRVSLNVCCQSETICTSSTKTIGLDSIIQDSLHPLNRNCKIQHCEIYLKDKKNSLIKAKKFAKKTFSKMIFTSVCHSSDINSSDNFLSNMEMTSSSHHDSVFWHNQEWLDNVKPLLISSLLQLHLCCALQHR